MSANRICGTSEGLQKFTVKLGNQSQTYKNLKQRPARKSYDYEDIMEVAPKLKPQIHFRVSQGLGGTFARQLSCNPVSELRLGPYLLIVNMQARANGN